MSVPAPSVPTPFSVPGDPLAFVRQRNKGGKVRINTIAFFTPDALASHRKIAEAIRQGDAAVAAAAMAEHIKRVSDVALLRDS